MLDFFAHQLVKTFIFIILLFPLGLIILALQCLFPSQIKDAVFIIVGLLYFIYISLWAKKAADLHVFDNKSLPTAIRESRIQTNVDIRVKLCFLPLIGPFFSRITDQNQSDTKNKTIPAFKTQNFRLPQISLTPVSTGLEIFDFPNGRALNPCK